MVLREAGPADAEGVARVEIETWRDTYPMLLPASHLVGGLDRERRTAFWRQRLGGDSRMRTVVAAAKASGRIVGYATWGPCRAGGLPFAGELYELYLLPDRQGGGLGRRLCAAVGERCRGAGLSSLCVEVLEGNPSRFFYEALGARLAARAHRPFAGRMLATLVYAWDDLERLVGACAR